MPFVSRSCFISISWLIYFILYVISLTTSQVTRYGSHTKDSDSCETSAIQQNVTLRGGLKAGYFHKLAQYVAMELCVQLCCEEKGCDVAFMIGNNCYGVKCFSEALCNIIPAHKTPRTLMMAKVNFRGEVYLQTFMPAKLRCYKRSIEQNVTLKGGLSSGNFTAVGHVESIDACARLCCVSEHCDLAFLINHNCFIVKCHVTQPCQTVSMEYSKFQTYVARVHRTKEIVNDQQTVQALSSIHGKQSKLMCKNGIIQRNQTLLGGYNAGQFKMLSQATNMTTCLRLCCAQRTCDVAFMIQTKCYAVSCHNLKQCRTVPANPKSHLNPSLSYITSRNEEVSFAIQRDQNEYCKATIISYDVTLRGGKHAGRYKTFGDVSSMEKCINICCMEKGCDVAFMISGICFTVRCHNEEGCEEVHAPGTGFKPMISHVTRETTTPKPRRKHVTPKISNHRNKTVSQDVPHIPSPNLPSLDSANHHCTNSEIMYNVTLQGGINAGKYKDRGVLSNMEECLRVCCLATRCDLAFMLGNHCFSVTCRNQSLCEVVGARSSHLNPRVAYIYARSGGKGLNSTKNKQNKPKFDNKLRERKKAHETRHKQKYHRKTELTILEKLYGKDSLMLQNYFMEKLRKKFRKTKSIVQNQTLSNDTLKMPSIMLENLYQNHSGSLLRTEPAIAGVNISGLFNKTWHLKHSSPWSDINISNHSKENSNETTLMERLRKIGPSISQTNLTFDGYKKLFGAPAFGKRQNITKKQQGPLYNHYNRTNMVTYNASQSSPSELDNRLTTRKIGKNGINSTSLVNAPGQIIDQGPVIKATKHDTEFNYRHESTTKQNNRTSNVIVKNRTSGRIKDIFETSKNEVKSTLIKKENIVRSENNRTSVLISNETKWSKKNNQPRLDSLSNAGLLKNNNEDWTLSRSQLKTPLFSNIISSDRNKTAGETNDENKTDSLLQDAFTFENNRT